MSPGESSVFGGTPAAFLQALGLAPSASAEDVVSLLIRDSQSLLTLLDYAAAGREPDTLEVPDIDQLVQDRLDRLYGSRVADKGLIRKRRAMGAQNRLLLALLLPRSGEWVPFLELLLANNLKTETSKRIRELREEHGGWRINVSGSGRSTQYRLESASPDLDASARWWLADNIRNANLSPSERILTLLQAHLGVPVPLSAILHVNPRSSGGGKGRARQAQSETSRRVRELREEGWQVYSGLDKLVAGLAPSDYIMLTLDRLPAYERLKPKTWKEVIERDNRTCQSCAWAPAAGPSQGRKCLEVHHRNPQHARPEDVNDSANLVTLCNVCHDAAS